MPRDDAAAAARDERRYYRELGQRDDDRSRAYNQGERAGRRRGERPAFDDAELDDLASEGERAGQRARRRDAASETVRLAARSGPARRVQRTTSDASGFVLGVLAYALLFAYLEDGVPGVRAWLAAKFLNRVPGDPTPSTTSSTTSSGTSSSAPRTNTALYRSPIGAAGEPAGFTFPVMGGARFSDDWGQARSGGRKHEGTDLFAPRGSPVVAAVAGTVLDDFTDSLGGNVVRVLGLDGRRYYYAHLNSVSATAGALVAAGDALGTVGNTGNARGADPHLHFGVYESIAGKWRARDPFAWLSDALSGPRSRSSAAGWA